MRGITDHELQRLILSVGTHGSSRPLSPSEVSDLIARAVDAGTSRAECAERIRIGKTQLSSFLRLQDLDPDLRHLASWGRQPGGIPFSSLSLIAQLDEARDQRHAAAAVLENDLSWKEIVQLIQIFERSGAPLDAAVSRVVALRPELERRYVVIGSIADQELVAQLAEMSQLERDELLAEILAGGPFPSGVSGRLGPQVFTLVAPAQLGADTAEKELNLRLRALLEAR